MAALTSIAPDKARALIQNGAILIDIREADERARARISKSIHAPLSKIRDAVLPTGKTAVIFHCKTGNRTSANAGTLSTKVDCDAYLLDGGLDAWSAAGLPTVVDKKQPIEIMRQVQITAGSLVLLGIALGVYVSPMWFALSAFIGAGLVFSGVSGSCAMAKALKVLPWNQSA